MTYADDITILAQHPKHETAATHLQQYIHELEQWLTNNRLKVSTNKSSLTLITPYNREYTAQPHVTLFGTPIPVTDTATILGVTFDRGMTFKEHTNTVNTKAKTRLNVLRAVTHTTYGSSTKDTTTLYKQFIRPVLTYAHTAWHPDTKKTHIDKLQITQNTALRIATGCTNTTPIQHLQDETKVLPLMTNMDMRGTQQYTSTSSPTHPLHYMQTPTITPRHIHNTPAEHFRNLYQSLPPCPENLSERAHIHRVFTERYLDSAPPNSLLESRPPPVNPCDLPRGDEVHLHRLRCGHHTSFPYYMERIGRAPSRICSLCNGAVGTVEHALLHCPTIQQHRDTFQIHSLEHLWTHPEESLRFLRDSGVVPEAQT